ncbi:MAG TPA: hypothetical protein PLU22_05175 [Polyangiaceae bacterium]|nr:hypothetical protein [Polyangiaceae bacterium]
MRSILHAARRSTLFAATLLASGALGSTAWAAEGDPCTADVDCGDGYACEVEPNLEPPSIDEPGAAGASGTSEERAGTCVIARRPCTSDADCEANYECEIYDAPSTVVCDEAGNCEAVPPEESTTGECVGVPMDCSTDADCPEASACMSGLCTFSFTPCTADTDCGDLELCLPDGGEVCTSYDCAPNDPACEPVIVCEPAGDASGYCFPAPQPCTSDAACTGEWTCYDVPNDNDLPEPWVGVDKSCLPPGIVGAVEGWVAVEGAETSDDSAEVPVSGDRVPLGAAGMGPVVEGDGDAAPRGDGGASGEADGAEDADLDATASAAAETDDSGCRAAGAGATGTSALALLLAAAGLAVGRRRTRRSR